MKENEKGNIWWIGEFFFLYEFEWNEIWNMDNDLKVIFEWECLKLGFIYWICV